MQSNTPKQYLTIEGRTLLDYAASTLLGCPAVQRLVIARHADDVRMTSLALVADPRVHLVEGGAERADSVLAALDSLDGLAADQDWVLVHDAARPCLTSAIVDAMLSQLDGHAVGNYG